MTGNPLRQFCIALACVLCIAWLLYHITANNQTQQSHTEPPHKSTLTQKTVLLNIKCAHVPQTIRITHGQQTLYQAQPGELFVEQEISVPSTANPLRLTVQATWQANTPDTPITLMLESAKSPIQSQTQWSFGATLHDSYIFTLP